MLSSSRSALYEPLRTSPIANDDDIETDLSSSLSHQNAKWSRRWRTRVIEPIANFWLGIWESCAGFVRVNAGLLLVAASQAFFALMNVAVKKLNSLDPPVPALELVCVRMGITYICCLSYLLWRKVPDPILGPKGVRHLLAIRGFTGFFGLFGVYYSLQYLSLSDATVLTFLAPLTTAVSGYFFLGEAFHKREALAGLLSLVGVVLIARPEAIFGSHSSSADAVGADDNVSPGQRLGAVGVALLGVLGATGAYTSMRAIGRRAHTLHSMSYFSLWCVITSTTGMILLGQKFIFPTRLEWLALLLMIGIFGFLAQALLTMGLQRETAGRGSLAIYVQIIYATILERMFFHTVPSALSIVGTLIIMGSAVYVALTKSTSKPSEGTENAAITAATASTTVGGAAFDLELGQVAEAEVGGQMARSRHPPPPPPPGSGISGFIGYGYGHGYGYANRLGVQSNASRIFLISGQGQGQEGLKSKSEVSLIAADLGVPVPVDGGEKGRRESREGGAGEEKVPSSGRGTEAGAGEGRGEGEGGETGGGEAGEPRCLIACPSPNSSISSGSGSGSDTRVGSGPATPALDSDSDYGGENDDYGDGGRFMDDDDDDDDRRRLLGL